MSTESFMGWRRIVALAVLAMSLKTVWAVLFRGMRDVVVPANLDPVALYAELEAAGAERVYAVHQSGGSLVIALVADV